MRASRKKAEVNGSAENSDAKSVGANTEKTSSIFGSILHWDERFTSICAVFADKSSTLRPLMKLIEISCHGIPWLIGTVLLILSVHQAHHIEILVNLFYGLVLDLIGIGILKTLFRRARPPHNEMDMFATVSIDNYSFPSGHASRAGMLACFFIQHVVTAPKMMVWIVLWSLVVTMSRVLLGRHHLIDVICGYVVGVQEYLILTYLWIPRETCMSWLELYFSHFHL